VKFLGCGSAYYAGQMGAVLTEELARIPSDAEPASEFRYRNPVVDPTRSTWRSASPARRWTR
jgi:Glucosamine 6-phosphate synthetase, contains amidotransferase and phosphosugar isomerase domains